MKNKKGLNGFLTVFSFTAAQSVKGKNFKRATVGIFALIFVLFFCLNILIMLFNDDDEYEPDNEEPVQCEYAHDKIYICNNTGFLADVSLYESAFKESFDKNVKVENIEGVSVKDVEDMAKSDSAAGYIFIYENNGAYKINYYEQKAGDDEAADIILEICDGILRETMIRETGISEELLPAIYAWHEVEVFEAGESRNIGVIIMGVLLPMLLCLFMYMIVLINGQSITKVVIAEKSSKLMEMLLTSVKPYEVIAGKVLGMAAVALSQTFLWIIAGVAGFIAGDYVAKLIEPSYGNIVIDIINVIKESAPDAFSVSSVILSLIFVVVGFLFYCTISAMAASLLSKAEDLSNASAMFQIPVVAAFLLSYLAPVIGNEALLGVVRILPLTSPFSVPADILTGSVGMGFALISLLVIIISLAALTVFTGKMYKGRVFGKH